MCSVYIDIQPPILLRHGRFIVLSLNIHSLACKHDQLNIFIEILKTKNITIDAICLQECYLIGPDVPEVDPKDFHKHLALDHYKFVPQGRSVGMTGGLAIYIHDSYRVKPRVPLSCRQADREMVFVDIFSGFF